MKLTPSSKILNSKKWIFAICLAQLAAASIAFLVYDANSMGEYCVAFFTLTTLLEAGVAYFITLGKLENIWLFIDSCEKFIEKSESNRI